MTARGILLALTLLASTPVEAHCYSVWRYPWAQRCMSFGQKRENVRIVAETPEILPKFGKGPEIALPSLARTDLDGGAADEPTRAKALLRAALEAVR